MAKSKNLIVKALAGVGKTTTMIWAVAGVPKGVKLSDEQQAIVNWVRNQKIAKYRFLAFNKTIATELASRVPANCEAATCHSSGLAIIKRNHGTKIKVVSWKYRKIMDTLLGEPKKSPDFVLRNAVNSIIDLARSNMLGYNNDGKLELSLNDIDTLRECYDIDGEMTTEQLLDVANKALAVGSNNFKSLDFADMVWMPSFHSMDCTKVGGVIIDEMQDLNRAQQQLVMMQGHQIIGVGDVNQAIYGFAGADAGSMGRMQEYLTATGGCDVLPLTETRRCGKNIVDSVLSIVPEYRAHESNGDGVVAVIEKDKLIDDLKVRSKNKDTVMVLCRTNAPLVSLAFRLLKTETKVVIRGRDIGQGLIKLVEKLAGKSNDVDAMLSKLDAYSTEEETKIMRRYKYGADEKLVALHDKVDCIRILSGDCKGVNDLTNKLGRLFQDTAGKGQVVLSSVHKAKGLEADWVYIFKPHLLPHPKLIDKANGSQEINLKYVAYTRAIKYLMIVNEVA